MHHLQVSVTSCFFHHTALVFGGILLTTFTPSYGRTAVASPISRGLGTRSVLVARDSLLYRSDDPDDSSWLTATSNIVDPNGVGEVVAEHQSLPNDASNQDSQESQQPASEPVPDPQPAPAPAPEPAPRPLPRPKPIEMNPIQPAPGRDVPVPDYVPPPLPIVPLPIPGALPVPVPLEPIPNPVPPARPSNSPKTYPKARPLPVPVGGIRGGTPPTPQNNPRPQTPAEIPRSAPGRIINRDTPEKAPLPTNGPAESDYPSTEIIRRRFLGVEKDECVMYTETQSLQYPRAFAASFTPVKWIYLDAWPYNFLNIRSFEWFREFNERCSEVFAEACEGIVWVVSKFPGGPEFDCSLWSMIEWPVLKANPKVEKIILVNYLDFSQQREIWPNPVGDAWPPSPAPSRKNKFKRQDGAYCDNNADLLNYNGYPDMTPGPNTDLTPVLGNAAGWASVDVVQYRPNDPDLNPSDSWKLDITILDAHGEDIGNLMGASAPAGQDIHVSSKLPFALLITAQAADLVFHYGSTSWTSTDQSDAHQCAFDEWKGAEREGICNFQY